VVAPWALDIDGNGVVDGNDRAIIARSLGSVRGFGVRPMPGYDYRADLRGIGQVTAEDLEAFDAHAIIGPAAVRPEVICWHYGWYQGARRTDELTTATFLGGDYDSHNARFEADFNDLKNEFGITAELLSWISPPSHVDDTLNNYNRGYFAAANARTRRFGFLYETTINLGLQGPVQLWPGSTERQRLVEHFRGMARRFVDPGIGTTSAGILRIDGRPVIYLFASHLLGGGSLLPTMDAALALQEARQAFIDEAGVPPYLIGDESPALDDRLDDGRRLRASFFDAVTRYHHYDEQTVAAFAADGPVHLGGDYMLRMIEAEQRALAVFAGLRNRYTGTPVLVIPSSAAGFAKRGLPPVLASRHDYVAFLRAMRQIAEQHVAQANAETPGGARYPAPPVIVGSWNEEFEGHAVFPAARNEAMVPGGFGGFEWLSAIKEVYGSSPLHGSPPAPA
jgi:hypothetical protein